MFKQLSVHDNLTLGINLYQELRTMKIKTRMFVSKKSIPEIQSLIQSQKIQIADMITNPDKVYQDYGKRLEHSDDRPISNCEIFRIDQGYIVVIGLADENTLTTIRFSKIEQKTEIVNGIPIFTTDISIQDFTGFLNLSLEEFERRLRP